MNQIEHLETAISIALETYNASKTIEEKIEALRKLAHWSDWLRRWLEENPQLSAEQIATKKTCDLNTPTPNFTP